MYFFQPVLNFNYYGLPFLFLFLSGISTFVIFALDNRISIVTGAILLFSILFFLIIPFFSTAKMFRSARYYQQVGNVQVVDFEDVIDPIDILKIRLVDQNMAERLGDKKIGEDPALGSITKIGNYNIQMYDSNLYWVAPLLHSSFFKWIKHREGTNGYILVSATNPQDVRLVQSSDGKDVRIKYAPNAFFGDKLSRHIYFNGFLTSGFTDYTFEIDEKGSSYWVVSRFKKTIGYSGKEVISTILVNAITGDIQEYNIEETPSWVDRIQPESFIKEQVNNWGKYAMGWANSIFTQEGVLQLTPGISLVYGNNGKSYWYSGLTSAGSDESTVGFILVDTRDKSISFYKQPGATERSAMSSAEGKVQEKRYNSTFPIMYNIMGIPTYISSLKDKGGLIKLVAMVSVEDYTIIGVGDSTETALRSYRSALSKSLIASDLEQNLTIKKVEGYVERIHQDIQSGISYYYIKLSEGEDIYLGDSAISPYLVVTEENDYVQIECEDSSTQFFNISTFTNRTLQY